MSELETRWRISITGADELPAFFRKNEAAAREFGRKTGEALRETGAELRRFSSEIGRGMLAIGGLGAGLGIAEQAKDVLELRDAIEGLAASAGLPATKIGELTEEIESASLATNQFGKDMGAAVQAFKDQGGSVEDATKNLALYGKVATATRTSAAEAAKAGAAFEKMGVGQQAGFNIFAKQRDLLGVAPRLLSAFESGGIQGEAGLQKGVALARVFRGVLGDPEATRNAVETAFQGITEHQDQLQAEGVNVFDPKTHDARNRVDVILDVIRKAKGRPDILARIFGGRALKAINPLANEFRETGDFGTFNNFMAEKPAGNEIDQMFAANSHTALAEIKRTRIQMEQASNRNFGDAVEGLAKHSGVIGSAFDFATAHPLLAGGGALGAMTLRNMLRGGAGGEAGGGLGGLASSVLTGGKGMPVYVTNAGEIGGGLGGPSGSLPSKLGEAAKETGVFAMAAKNAGSLLMSFGVGYAIGSWIDQKTGLSDKLAGVSPGQIAGDENRQAQDPGTLASRELAQAQGLAKQVKAGKLLPDAAARQLEVFSRSIEGHQKNAELGGAALELADELRTGRSDRVLGRSDKDIRNELLFLDRKRSAGRLPVVEPGQGTGEMLYDDAAYSGANPLNRDGVPELLAAEDTRSAFGPSERPSSDFAGDVQRGFERALANVPLALTINIDPDGKATVEGAGGTRSPEMRVRRNAVSR